MAEEKRSQLKAARAEVRKAVRAENYKKRKAAFMELEDKVKDLESQLHAANVELGAANAKLDASNAKLDASNVQISVANANAEAAIKRADQAEQHIGIIEVAFSDSIRTQKSLDMENMRLAYSLGNYINLVTICFLCSLLYAGIYIAQTFDTASVVGFMENVPNIMNKCYSDSIERITNIYETAPVVINTAIQGANTFAVDLYARIPEILNHNTEFLQRFA